MDADETLESDKVTELSAADDPSSIALRQAFAERFREIRRERFGDQGGPELARRLNLPARTMYNYETGVTVPAEVLLRFLEETGADGHWLLTGTGPKYRDAKA